MGSPETKALGTIGSVVSHSLVSPNAGGAAAAGAPGSHRSPAVAAGGAAACGRALCAPAGADQLRAASSLALAALRSAASLSI